MHSVRSQFGVQFLFFFSDIPALSFHHSWVCVWKYMLLQIPSTQNVRLFIYLLFLCPCAFLVSPPLLAAFPSYLVLPTAYSLAWLTPKRAKLQINRFLPVCNLSALGMWYNDVLRRMRAAQSKIEIKRNNWLSGFASGCMWIKLQSKNYQWMFFFALWESLMLAADNLFELRTLQPRFTVFI